MLIPSTPKNPADDGINFRYLEPTPKRQAVSNSARASGGRAQEWNGTVSVSAQEGYPLTFIAKAISLKGPALAEAILSGYKDIENRNVRMSGWVAIHISKDRSKHYMRDVMEHFIPTLQPDLEHQRGHIVGLARID